MPIVKRTQTEVFAQSGDDQASTSLALQTSDPHHLPLQATGTLIYRTYEVDLTWSVRCEA